LVAISQSAKTVKIAANPQSCAKSSFLASKYLRPLILVACAHRFQQMLLLTASTLGARPHVRFGPRMLGTPGAGNAEILVHKKMETLK
jgi:hypothetical protein